MTAGQVASAVSNPTLELQDWIWSDCKLWETVRKWHYLF